MSHFAVLVIGDNIERQLARYDENLEVAPYVEATREQLIAKERASIENYKNGTYAKYLKDPVKYAEGCSNNSSHLKYISEEFPKKLTWTDEEVYADAIKYVEDADMGSNGEIWSIYNPLSKWDWYTVGGRYRDRLKTSGSKNPALDTYGNFYAKSKEGMCDSALRKDIENWDEISCFAILFHGEWIERGKMGWWACVSDEKEEDEWAGIVKKMKTMVKPDDLVTYVDCHI